MTDELKHLVCISMTNKMG